MSSDRPVLPPMPAGASTSKPEKAAKTAHREKADKPPKQQRAPRVPKLSRPARRSSAPEEPSLRRSHRSPESQRTVTTTTAAPTRPRSRQAHLRLVRIDAWSVMKTAFLLSIAVGIVMVVAVGIIWGVLGAAGVWDSINSMVQQVVGNQSNSSTFDITQYVGTSRVLGFTMIVAVVDVILITAIATLAAFVYNLAATLLGGIEVTLAEDR